MTLLSHLLKLLHGLVLCCFCSYFCVLEPLNWIFPSVYICRSAAECKYKILFKETCVLVVYWLMRLCLLLLAIMHGWLGVGMSYCWEDGNGPWKDPSGGEHRAFSKSPTGFENEKAKQITYASEWVVEWPVPCLHVNNFCKQKGSTARQKEGIPTMCLVLYLHGLPHSSAFIN